MQGHLDIVIKSIRVPVHSSRARAESADYVWGRVTTARSKEPWIDGAPFAAQVGWQNSENVSSGQTSETAAPEFTFWPPSPLSSPQSDVVDDGSNDGVDYATSNADDSWAWTRLCKLVPLLQAEEAEVQQSHTPSVSVLHAEILYDSDQGHSNVKPTRSRPIPLSQEHLTAVLNTTVVVEIFRGKNRTPEGDALLGHAVFGAARWDGSRLGSSEGTMAQVLFDPCGVEVEIAVELAVEKHGLGDGMSEGFDDHSKLSVGPASVVLSVSADSALLQFCKGARVFSCLVDRMNLHSEGGSCKLPKSWNLPHSADDIHAPESTCRHQEFTISCDFLRHLIPSCADTLNKSAGIICLGQGTVNDLPETVHQNVVSVSWPRVNSSIPSTLMHVFVGAKDIQALRSLAKQRISDALAPCKVKVCLSNVGGGSESATPYLIASVPFIHALSEPGALDVYESITLVEDSINCSLDKGTSPGDMPSLNLYAKFSTPLVPAQPLAPKQILKPIDIMAARPPPPRSPPTSASQLLHDEVHRAAVSIVSEICNVFGPEIQHNGSSESRRRHLLYHLNTAGTYASLRNRLKHCMGRLVKERFPSHASLATGSAARDKFISDLYVLLVESVFVVLESMFSADKHMYDEQIFTMKGTAGHECLDSTPRTADVSGLRRLGLLALEAETVGDTAQAAEYHQDRIALSEKMVASSQLRQATGLCACSWVDYAAFSARFRDYEKASECCRAAIALLLPAAGSPAVYARAVMMMSCILCRDGNTEEAKIMLTPLVNGELQLEDNKQTEACACTLMSFVHLLCDRETQKAAHVLAKALRMSGPSASSFDLHHNLVAWLVCTGFTGMANRVMDIVAKAGCQSTYTRSDVNESKLASNEHKSLDDESIAWRGKGMTRRQRLDHLWLGGSVSYAEGHFSRAERLLQAAIEIDRSCGEAWAVLGHVLSRIPGQSGRAIGSFLTALPLLENRHGESVYAAHIPTAQLGLLYTSLGHMYLRDGEHLDPAAAKEMFLRACRFNPTCSSWLGAGQAASLLRAFREAEDAFAEANILNNRNPYVWGQLALLCLRHDVPRVNESNHALRQAQQLGLPEDSRLMESIRAARSELALQQDF